MTVEEAEKLKDVIGTITLSDILNGANKLLDKFDELNTILGEISDNDILSPDTMNKIVKNFPNLLKGTDESGNVTISRDNIIRNLTK